MEAHSDLLRLSSFHLAHYNHRGGFWRGNQLRSSIIFNDLKVAQRLHSKECRFGGSHEKKVLNTLSEIRFAHVPSWRVFDTF
jgi:hypothetical protein